MNKLLLLLFFPFQLLAQPFSKTEIARWQQQAKQVNIIRDNWGIPHIYGKTDADAVFGLLYAQCEDDFKRVEMNYIEKLGRLSEVKGESEWKNDLFLKLLIDAEDAKKDFAASPVWLKKLMTAFADGVNFYMYKHPTVKPALLTRFEPWFPLLWTDGSIGAISTGGVSQEDVGNLFSGKDVAYASRPDLPKEQSAGSNGFAVGPSKTASGNAILYINPHVTFYFRPEVHVVSEEGLNVYGAVTWGQFFVYQGFNEHCGWMHTSSNVDVADNYKEKIKLNSSTKQLVYEYNGKLLPVKTKNISISIKMPTGLQRKTYKAMFTKHGPVMAKWDGQYISVQSYNRSLKSLLQSWGRTKSSGLESYKQNMQLYSNTSNNTVFADDKGNIAYWHGNFVPKRNPSYDWGKAVDGTTSATDWKGLHNLDEMIHVYNPATGFIQNCNSTPFTVSGSSSPVKKDYPNYMSPDGENFRGVNASRLLAAGSTYTIDKLIATGYDRRLTAFEILVPALVNRFEKNLSPNDSLYALLAEPVQVLKAWDFNVDENSVATTIAVEWAERLNDVIRRIYIEEGEKDQVEATRQFAADASDNDLLLPLAAAIKNLTAVHGDWKITWGTINRYQRISSDINQQYKDDAPSFPIGFASSVWGALPAYVSQYLNGSTKRYGTSGNSFICAVEFGKKIKAKSLLAGGNSGNPASPHFTDQLEMYTKGQFKEVLFYKEDVLKHAERQYHPGE